MKMHLRIKMNRISKATYLVSSSIPVNEPHAPFIAQYANFKVEDAQNRVFLIVTGKLEM